MEKERIPDWGGSTEEYFMIDSYRIPRKGLDTVYLAYECRGGGPYASVAHMHYYELEFCYEDGAHFSVGLLRSEEKDFEQLIRRYEDSVQIYRHRKMKGNAPLLCPFKRLRAEEPFVRKETMEELSTLCSGNPFWRLGVKSRSEYNGNKEVELTLCGTALTWLLWLAWLSLSVYLFFFVFIRSKTAGLLVALGGGLCYYLFFIRSARKITEKAKVIFYQAIFRGNIESCGKIF